MINKKIKQPHKKKATVIKKNISKRGGVNEGRPSKYSIEIATEICDRIVNGESLISIARDNHMPVVRTVYLWLDKHNKFMHRYTQAKEDQADTLAEELLDIADNGSNDWMETNDPNNTGYKVNGEAINRARLRVDTRKWLASKLKAKKYGDKGITVNNNTQINITEANEALDTKLLKLIDANKGLEK